MYGNHHILAIIPARGGSKGIKRKNLCLLNGNPLIKYTIESAKGARYLDRFLVSTDDSEICDYVYSEGAEVHHRSSNLGGDEITMGSVVFEVINRSDLNENYDTVVLLQPTSPLRTSEDIDNAIEHFYENQPSDSLISVVEPFFHPMKSFLCRDGKLRSVFEEESVSANRQFLQQIVCQNGAIYIVKTRTFYKNSLFLTSNTVPFYMSKLKSFDIDSYEDLKIAELILKYS